jgi:Fe-S-cluster-containing dehydrogenase component
MDCLLTMNTVQNIIPTRWPANRYTTILSRNGGIKVNETILEAFEKIAIDHIPLPTDLCNLCVQRASEGTAPACVKHCQAPCMMYGSLTELAKVMEGKLKTVLFAPR